MKHSLNRRTFLGSTVASGAFTIVPRHVLGGPGYVAPNDKIALAHIGMGTQSIREIGALLADPRIQIVSVCDPNKDSSDYVEWGKNNIRQRVRSYLGNDNWRADDNGCPGGRDVGREIVDTYYAKQRAADNFKGCSVYADFRELLEKETDLDAVKIMTPDHLHAAISVAAMKKGKHILMHKPLANRMHEGKLVVETARATKVATHMLAYGIGSENGRIVERIKEGVIGSLREIHNWTNRPVWPQYTGIPSERPPVPEGFDWDLWLGPAKSRPFHPNYTHTVFRGWYEFGGGSMADMGIYSLWPVFTGLNLGVPVSAESWATHTCAIVDNVSRSVKNDFSYPAACRLHFRFTAEADRPSLELFWYDGGMKPRLPRDLEELGVEIEREGILFVGDEGTILAKFHGANPRLFAKGRSEPLDLHDAGSRDANKGGRHSSWLDACAGGDPSPGCFTNAAGITDAVNLGTVALRARKRVVFDNDKMQIANAQDANKFLRRDYREGWEL